MDRILLITVFSKTVTYSLAKNYYTNTARCMFHCITHGFLHIVDHHMFHPWMIFYSSLLRCKLSSSLR
jgi:hypothetical protein